MKTIWTRQDKPLLVLAPMAGYTDSAFRQLCRQYGADIVMTELVSADAIAYGKNLKEQVNNFKNKKFDQKKAGTAELINFTDSERPIAVQLFGKYPEKFAAAAKWISEELKPDAIDINMGCPARKVVGSDHGAALLKNCDLAVEIVKAVKANTKLPVSVKTRLGWEGDDEILKFAPRLMEAGIEAIIIHGRTYRDGFKGKARWDNIYKIKTELADPDSEINSKFQIPDPINLAVIGNGDISSYHEAIERANLGPCVLDGVAIGRATFGKPWIFSEHQPELNGGKLKTLILAHANLAWESKGERGIIEMRKHLLAYLKGFDGARELRMAAVNVSSLDDVKNLVERIGE